jgi:hypothetical protein
VKAWAGGWEGPRAEKAKNVIPRIKIQTLTTMPLKVFIIATFKRLLSDFSPYLSIIIDFQCRFVYNFNFKINFGERL